MDDSLQKKNNAGKFSSKRGEHTKNQENNIKQFNTWELTGL